MLTIEATELKALVQASDQAHQELIQASEAWLGSSQKTENKAR
ncbi:hypothetical protein QVM62_28755 [Pseudomonas putida]